jgi:hypothetical protein
MWISPKEAAEKLDITPHAVRAAIRRGALPAKWVLGRLRIDSEALERIAAGVDVVPKAQDSNVGTRQTKKRGRPPASLRASTKG